MRFDENYIKIAIFNLKQIIGTTFPNPPVFSILVESDKLFKNHKIVSFGITSFGGRPHAESNAIEKFKFVSNKKYTLYSTLEPCCHLGRSESCTSKIIKSKFIQRVVFSVFDPDKRVSGLGKKELEKENIKVVSGICEEEVKKIYEGYFLNKLEGRPKIILKVAMSLDGYITKHKKKRTSITNRNVNKFSNILRSEFDGILVGSNTVKIDNCLLTCREQVLKKYSPLRIILNKDFDLNIKYKIFKNCIDYRTILITKKEKLKKKLEFQKQNIEVYSLNSKYNLNNILKLLAKLGITNLLVEGGSRIFTNFLKNQLFDEIFLFRSNFFVGSKGLNLTEYEEYDFSNMKFQILESCFFGEDKLEILKVIDR